MIIKCLDAVESDTIDISVCLKNCQGVDKDNNCEYLFNHEIESNRTQKKV